jgi:hypothetical protein
VLTVSQDPENGGRFRSITEALNEVKPGMTVRVLDAATYRERFSLTDAARYAGVTLEAVAGATIRNEAPNLATFAIFGVPDVSVRGFRLHATGSYSSHFWLQGNCAGTTLENLSLAGEPGSGWNGIEFKGCNPLDHQDRPVVVRGCELRGLKFGVVIAEAKRVVVRDNDMRDMQICGIQTSGTTSDVQCVANRIERCGRGAIELSHLNDASDRVLIANNTLRGCASELRVDDRRVPPGNIRVVNNLSLESGTPDYAFFKSEEPGLGVAPGDVESLGKAWTFANNWRETRSLADEKAWIPPSATDVIRETIEGIDRDPASPDYLRPAADSPLATEGAGRTEPSLPLYVGALPPAGVDPWDWDRTWLAPPGTSELLTVSKDPEKGGRHRSITDALAAAKPWATIRVLDDAEYPDSITLDDPERHRGIVLETTRRAALGPLTIADVPHVVVRGFQFVVPSQALRPAVSITGAVEGTRLEHLDFPRLSDATGIGVFSPRVPPDGRPVIIERCRFAGDLTARGIQLSSSAGPAGRVCVRENSFEALGEGIEFGGTLEDVQIVANAFRAGTMLAIDVADVGANARGVVVANNTTVASRIGLQITDYPPYETPSPGGAEIAGNVFLGSIWVNLAVGRMSETDGKPFAIDPAIILETWDFRANWRDQSGPGPGAVPPIEGKINLLTAWPFESHDPNDPASTRPKPDSPLATGGAGGDLPSYAGATPPAGVEPWDWDVTWRSRARRTPD